MDIESIMNSKIIWSEIPDMIRILNCFLQDLRPTVSETEGVPGGIWASFIWEEVPNYEVGTTILKTEGVLGRIWANFIWEEPTQWLNG